MIDRVCQTTVDIFTRVTRYQIINYIREIVTIM
jgi:hypothetical protein